MWRPDDENSAAEPFNKVAKREAPRHTHQRFRQLQPLLGARALLPDAWIATPVGASDGVTAAGLAIQDHGASNCPARVKHGNCKWLLINRGAVRSRSDGWMGLPVISTPQFERRTQPSMRIFTLLSARAAVLPVSSHAYVANFPCKGNSTIMYIDAVKEASGRYGNSFVVNNYSRRTMTIEISLGPDTPT